MYNVLYIISKHSLSVLSRMRVSSDTNHNPTLLSSMTVFSDSIHIGSMSPSRTIHFGPSCTTLDKSRMTTENKPETWKSSRYRNQQNTKLRPLKITIDSVRRIKQHLEHCFKTEEDEVETMENRLSLFLT